MTTHTILWNGTPIQLDVHPTPGPAKAAILYLHGGALLYGTRQDLPSSYIQTITGRGFYLVCADYLLSPESPLRDIHHSVDLVFDWFLSHCREHLGPAVPYVLFGRSAGGYLALTLAHRACTKGLQPPAALWCFYGYSTLLHPLFLRPSSYYLRLPQLPEELCLTPSAQAPLSQDPIERRFYLYTSARQKGIWPQLLSPDPQELEQFSVPPSGLALLPPAFLTASTSDQDVPFSFSKVLSQQIPGSQFLPVFGLEHDYDRNPALPESQTLYETALNWLDCQLYSAAPPHKT